MLEVEHFLINKSFTIKIVIFRKMMVGKSGLNFNYEGPPVTVSNGMALDLVSKFGIQNAWFAILKLTGMNMFKEESEKAKALKHFRNKVQRIKKNVENLKTRPDEFNIFLGKEFNQNILADSNGSEANKETEKSEVLKSNIFNLNFL